MKKQILFIHCAGLQGPDEGSSNLVAFLRKELDAAYEVLYPPMPSPENPSYELWKLKIEKEFAMSDGTIMLVGHSLGGSVLLKYLTEEKIRRNITALFLIAPPYWGKEDWEIEEYYLTDDFVSKLPPIQAIFLYHSRGDELVPFAHFRHYAKKFLQINLRELDGREHEFHYGLPELVKDIRSLDAVPEQKAEVEDGRKN